MRRSETGNEPCMSVAPGRDDHQRGVTSRPGHGRAAPSRRRGSRAGTVVAAILILTWGVPGCQTPATRDTSTGSTDLIADAGPLAVVRRLDHTLGVAVQRSGVLPAALGALDVDAVVLYPRAPVIMGRDRAHAVFGGARPDASSAARWTPIGSAGSSDGTMAALWGRLDWRADSSGTQVARASSYLAVWTKVSPTLWRIAAIDWTSVPPEIDLTNMERSPPVDRASLSGAAAVIWDADVAFAKLAADSGAPVAFRVFAAPNAFTFAGPGVFRRGPREIEESLASGPAGNATWEWKPVYARASADGSMGFTIGESSIVMRSQTGPPPVHLGKYLTVWQRQPDGSYRYLTDAGSER